MVTQDGFILQLQHVFKAQKGPNTDPQSDSNKLYPVIMCHGLMQCSSVFVVNEDDSLAFYLAEQGFEYSSFISPLLGTL